MKLITQIIFCLSLVFMLNAQYMCVFAEEQDEPVIDGTTITSEPFDEDKAEQ